MPLINGKIVVNAGSDGMVAVDDSYIEFFIPRAVTAMVGVLVNLVGLFAFHLVAAQVIPEPIFFLPVDLGTYIILGATALGMIIILPVGIRADRAKPPAEEA